METRHLVQFIIISLSIIIAILSIISPPSALGQHTRVYTAPEQPTGPHNTLGSSIVCQQYEAPFIPCPEHQKEDNDHMKKYMELCLEQEDTHVSTCNWFPLQPPTPDKRGTWSCHHTEKPQVPCMLGFKIRHTKSQRRTGADDSYINVEFYAKIPPVPDSTNLEYNVAQWVALGFSPRDRLMGDDLVIYCHPYMDRDQFNFNDSDVMYPDDIGVAINKYFKEGSGKQVYDAERNFDHRLGRIKNAHVTYHTFPQTTPGDPRWAILECQVSISSYILLKSKQELSVGIDLDMEEVRSVWVFMAMGSCLHPECLGDHPNNTEELATIARRTTPLAFHNKYWISNKTIRLYEAVVRQKGVKIAPGVKGLVITLSSFYLVAIMFKTII